MSWHNPVAVPPVGTSTRIPALDGLRCLAVGVVIAYHAGAPIPGDLGVQLFFVLSGFLITRLLLLELASSGTVDLRAFYFRRALRIVPAYVTFLGLSLILDTFAGDRWPLSLTLSAFTYTVNYWNAAHGHTSSIAHAWSLAVEEQFYLFWPAVLLIVMRRGASPTRVLVSSILLILAWRSVAYAILDLPPRYVYNAFECRFDSLAVGCLLATTEARWQRIRAAWWHPLLTLIFLTLSRLAHPIWHYGPGFTVDAMLLALFLVQCMALVRHQAWRWLDWWPIRFTGLALSYPLYLYHAWGFVIADSLGLGVVAGVLVGFGLAAGSYAIVERPCLALKRHWARVPAQLTHYGPGLG